MNKKIKYIEKYENILTEKAKEYNQKPWSSIFELFDNTEDDFFIYALTDGIKHHEWLANMMPPFVPPSVATQFVGQEYKDSLVRGFDVYKELKMFANKYNNKINSDTKILDFGCGWGRFIRLILKDVHHANIYGADINQGALEWCASKIPSENIYLLNGKPPTQIDSNFFDVVWAYSVFSHFPEWLHFLWINEIQRILKPGGIFMASTRKREWIHQAAGNFEFTDKNQMLLDYDSGRYCHQSPNQIWGETCISEQYAKREWGKKFQVVDYLVADPKSAAAQNLIVCTKK